MPSRLRHATVAGRIWPEGAQGREWRRRVRLVRGSPWTGGAGEIQSLRGEAGESGVKWRNVEGWGAHLHGTYLAEGASWTHAAILLDHVPSQNEVIYIL